MSAHFAVNRGNFIILTDYIKLKDIPNSFIVKLRDNLIRLKSPSGNVLHITKIKMPKFINIDSIKNTIDEFLENCIIVPFDANGKFCINGHSIRFVQKIRFCSEQYRNKIYKNIVAQIGCEQPALKLFIIPNCPMSYDEFYSIILKNITEYIKPLLKKYLEIKEQRTQTMAALLKLRNAIFGIESIQEDEICIIKTACTYTWESDIDEKIDSAKAILELHNMVNSQIFKWPIRGKYIIPILKMGSMKMVSTQDDFFAPNINGPIFWYDETTSIIYFRLLN